MSWPYRWNMFKARVLAPYWYLRHRFTPTTCGYGCPRWPRPQRRGRIGHDWVYPYGFVAEAGCPEHD